MSKKTIFIILVFIIVIGAAGFVIYRQSMFSGEVLSLNISGPDTATVGNEITYTVTYKNNGSFTLQKPELIFDMPDNSLTEDSKTRITQDLKDIYPGDEESVQIKTRLLGKEGDLKVAKAALSYTPQNLTVRYESDSSFITKIDTVPITLDFVLPEKIEQGKNILYSIDYFSNIDYPLENLSLKVDQTTGFNFVSATPTSLDNSEWKLPTLNQGQGGRININGVISADVNQNLPFSAELGMWDNGSFIVIKQATANVQVIQPLLYISQQVNGSESYVASPGEILKYQIFFRNVGSSPFQNLTASVKLDATNLDLSSIQPFGSAQGVQFQLNGNVISWDYNQNLQLKYLGAQQQGELDFAVKAKSADNVSVIDDVNISDITQNFSIKIK